VPGPICTVEGGTVKGRRVEVVHAEMNRAAQHVNALVAILGPALAEGDSSGESHCTEADAADQMLPEKPNSCFRLAHEWTLSNCKESHRYPGRAGGDRTHDRGIMRWRQSIGLIRRCRIGPKNAGSFVRWCQFGPVVSDWFVG
jgi:hypothetical protein